MKHVILASTSMNPPGMPAALVEKALQGVKDFHVQIEVGLWVFRTQECYSAVHELETSAGQTRGSFSLRSA